MKKWLSSMFILVAIWTIALLIFREDWGWWKDFSSVINKLGVGIGAILGGIGALTVIDDWVKIRRKRQYRLMWQRILSPSRLKNKEIQLIKEGDEIYGIDLTIKRMWWIRNPSTLHDLDFQGKDAQNINASELSEYKKKNEQGQQINFYSDLF
jgi:hypothetical protein